MDGCAETGATVLLMWNCAEAVYSLYFLPPLTKSATSVAAVRTFTPTSRSSPLVSVPCSHCRLYLIALVMADDQSRPVHTPHPTQPLYIPQTPLRANRKAQHLHLPAFPVQPKRHLLSPPRLQRSSTSLNPVHPAPQVCFTVQSPPHHLPESHNLRF